MGARSISAQVVNGEPGIPDGDSITLAQRIHNAILRSDLWAPQPALGTGHRLGNRYTKCACGREITDHHRLQLQPGKVFTRIILYFAAFEDDVGRGRLDVRGANCDLVAVEVRVHAATLLWVDDKDLSALIGEKRSREATREEDGLLEHADALERERGFATAADSERRVTSGRRGLASSLELWEAREARTGHILHIRFRLL